MKFRKNRFSKKRPIETILFIILVIFIVQRWYHRKNSYISHEESCQRSKSLFFSGTIEDAHYDNMNKNAFTIKLKHVDQKLILADIYGHAKCPVAKGDSIVKQSGESYYLVYKASVADSVIMLDFDCDRFLKK